MRKARFDCLVSGVRLKPQLSAKPIAVGNQALHGAGLVTGSRTFPAKAFDAVFIQLRRVFKLNEEWKTGDQCMARR